MATAVTIVSRDWAAQVWRGCQSVHDKAGCVKGEEDSEDDEDEEQVWCAQCGTKVCGFYMPCFEKDGDLSNKFEQLCGGCRRPTEAEARAWDRW